MAGWISDDGVGLWRTKDVLREQHEKDTTVEDLQKKCVKWARGVGMGWGREGHTSPR